MDCNISLLAKPSPENRFAASFNDTTMKSRQVLLIFLILTLQVSGQRVLFSYDAAGNRVLRVVEETPSDGLQTTSLTDSSQISIEKKPAISFLNCTSYNIFPNPSDGKVTIEISGIPEQTGNKVIIYNSSGRVVRQENNAKSKTEVDLSNEKQGVYLISFQSASGNWQSKVIVY